MRDMYRDLLKGLVGAFQNIWNVVCNNYDTKAM